MPPGADELADLPGIADINIDEVQLAALEDARRRVARRTGTDAAAALEAGCVVRLDRGLPLVACARGPIRAEHAASFVRGAADQAGIVPTVGDWVAVAVPPGHETGVIEEVLPRRTALARWRGGRRGEFQTLAANLDVVIVAAALGAGKVPLARIARPLVLARDCGIRAAVVFTKADRAEPSGLEQDTASVRRLAGEGVEVVVSSSAEGSGLAQVRALVAPRRVAVIVGASGAGKSTLLNALLGREALATGAVRARDDVGRHTTVARVMVKVPGAGVICDAPGLRSLPLVGHERGLALMFPEISRLAASCRFRDCTHAGEPGCAVRAAEAAGELDSVRLEAYLALAAEMRASAHGLDPDVTL